MQSMIRAFEVGRLGIQTQLGRSPLLYRLLHRLRRAPRSGNLVGPESDLCVEAPSGSGNSFFVNGFLMINPGVRLAHHHHVAAQLKRGVALGVPTAVILRDPIDCVVSRSYNAPWMVGSVFSQWIRFFTTAEALAPSLQLLSFESVTGDPESAVERINRRFARSFESRFPEASRVFGHMDAAYRSVVGDAAAGRNPNRPDPSKVDRQREIRPVVEAHRLAASAGALYRRLQDQAQ
jgi:hypothetical protein